MLASLSTRLARRRAGIHRDAYSADYFLSDRCEGYREYRESGTVSFVKRKLLERIAPAAGQRVLEIGCGRGEVLLECATRGATAVGIDYATDAARLSRETCGDRAPVLQADATTLPFADAAFDTIFLGDVLEHLTLAQAMDMLAETERVLVPGGKLILHTAPNVLFVRCVFPFVLLVFLLTGRFALVKMLVEQYRTIREFHVREYSAGRLQRLLRDSPFETFEVQCDRDLLRGGESRYTESLEQSRWISKFAEWAGREPFVRLLSNDLWATAERRREPIR